MKKKLLILTASYGTGHITAAKSIQQMISLKYPEIETKIVDVLLLHKKDKNLDKQTFIQKLYNFSMEKPIIFDVFFFLTNNKLCTSILNLIMLLKNYNATKNLLDEFKPDIIVSTHPYWNFLIKKYKKEVKNIPYICVITDSYMIHKAWIDRFVDYYFVIDEDTKHVLINNNIKNIYVTGFPVNYKLFEKVEKEKIIKELELDLDVNKKIILITIGLGATSRFIEIIEYLKDIENNFQLIIITGKYKDIYDYLTTKVKFKPKTKIIGWTDKMYNFLKISDIVICKAGGAIVSEALSCGVPVFIPLFVPAQEKGNVYIVKKYQMGFYEEDIEKVYKILDDIIFDRINLKIYKENIKKFIKDNPALIISNLINRILNNLI
ncbi:MAG: glycosyltransferase [Endomicrobiia bacterium]